jgi:hypothetical protein
MRERLKICQAISRTVSLRTRERAAAGVGLGSGTLHTLFPEQSLSIASSVNNAGRLSDPVVSNAES